MMNLSSSEKSRESTPEISTGTESKGLNNKDGLLDFFGLSMQPFGVTPDPRFLFLGSKHRQALAALDYGTTSNRGFLAIVAPPGMGKTSLLYEYLESLRGVARTAFVFQTDGNASDFMRNLLSDLDLDTSGKDLTQMRSMLNDVLVQEMMAGRSFVLVIDEAQNLDESVLESIRLLSNFETPSAKLMQIVMAGQPQLAERLAQSSMTQLRQRISFFIKIAPFNMEEMCAYIDHRLAVAGHSGPPLFTAGALRMIGEHSKGIPRTINNICFAAMSLAWILNHNTIDREIVADVLGNLDLGPADQKTDVLPMMSPSAAEEAGAPAVRTGTGKSSNPVSAASIETKAGRDTDRIANSPVQSRPANPVAKPWSLRVAKSVLRLHDRWLSRQERPAGPRNGLRRFFARVAAWWQAPINQRRQRALPAHETVQPGGNPGQPVEGAERSSV